MCNKNRKAEMVVHPAGQDWPRADPFAFASPAAGALWNRLCGRSRWLSCAILVAATVFVGIAAALNGISRLAT